MSTTTFKRALPGVSNRGIFRDARGVWLVRITVGPRGGRLTAREQFHADTPVADVKAAALRIKMRLLDDLAKAGDGVIARGTLAADVRRYFDVKKFKSDQRKVERTSQLKWWTAQRDANGKEFGTRIRRTLTHVELGAALNTLTLEPSTVNKYRTALSNVYTVLDGKSAANPFRDVEKADEPEAEPRDVSYEIIQVILAKLRDRGQGKKPSRTKATLRVWAYTGINPSQLARLKPTDVDLTAGVIYTRGGRHKGKGVAASTKPLSPEAVEAFKAFDAAGCWGKRGSSSSRGRIFGAALVLALDELTVTRPDLAREINEARDMNMTPKDLRHSFATVVFEANDGNLAVVGEFLDHKDPRTTKRYTRGGVNKVLAAAGVKAADKFATVPAYVPPPPDVVEKIASIAEARNKRRRKSGTTDK